MEALYRAAVGPSNADFYVPIFMRFDQPGASKISWNWSAFLVSFYWFLYRRMYGYWAVFCLLIPMILAIIGAITGALFGNKLGNALYTLAALGYSFVLIPLYANALYHRFMQQRIATLQQKVPDPTIQLAVLDYGPHTSNIVLVVLPFMFVAVVGILAAIAIPAYQNFAIRAQVAQGLMLANPLKVAVAERYASDKSWPGSLTDLAAPQPSLGDYVSAITVNRGTISITFGNKAHGLIAGYVLSLRPSVAEGGDGVVWACGYAVAMGEEPTSGSAARSRTDVAPRYLPSLCRGDSPH